MQHQITNNHFCHQNQKSSSSSSSSIYQSRTMSNINPNFLGSNIMPTPPSSTNPNLHFSPFSPDAMLQHYDYDYAQDFELSYVNNLLNDDDHLHYSNVVNPFASSSSSSSLFSQPPPTIVQDKSSTTSASSGSSGFDGGIMPTTYPMQVLVTLSLLLSFKFLRFKYLLLYHHFI